MDLSAKCTKIIKILFLLLFALVPLLLTPWNYELFEYNKMMAVYALTVMIATAWGIKAIYKKKIVIPKTPLDIPIALFVISQTISTLFSIDPHVSWFGYYSRFNGGLLSTLSYVVLYYIFMSTYSIQNSNHESRITNIEYSRKDKKKNKQQDISAAAIQYSQFSIQSSIFSLHPSVFNLLYASLISTALVAVYGVLERMGIDSHLWVQDVQSRVFSTLGQPNWLAAYIVALAPIAWTIGIETGDWRLGTRKQITSIVLSILFFFVLLSTRSKSGLGAFVISDILFWGLLFWASQHAGKLQGLALKQIRIPFFVLHAAFFLIVFFNGIYVESFDKYFTYSSIANRFINEASQSTTPNSSPPPQNSKAPLLEAGGTDSGIIRKYVWTGAITAWKSSVKTFLIGTGTETFAFAFFEYRPKEHNLTSEWDFLYNKAHNEYVNFLTTTGVFGLLSYLSILGVFIAWFIRMLLRPSNPPVGGEGGNNEYGILKKTIPNLTSIQYSQFTIQLALISGYASILITNFFGFSVVITQIFLFLFPAIVFVLFNTQSTNPNTQQGERILKLTLQHPFDKASMWIIAVSGVSLVVLIGIFWDADRLFAHGYRLSRGGKNEEATYFTEQAILRNPGEPLYHDELATELASSAVAAMDANEATRASALAQRAIKENDVAITTSPKNVNFWKSRVKILYAFTAFDPSLLKLSLETLKKAQELSPQDPKILYNIAVIAGKQGDSATAITALKNAIEMKQNYRDAYYALYIFYTESKQGEKARATLEDYLKNVDPSDKELKELVQ